MRHLLVCALLMPGSLHAWTIESFDSDIAIRDDGSVVIEEVIAADFGSEEKHGIYRDIPLAYESAEGPVYTRVSEISVAQDDGDAIVDFEQNSANMRIRIGDPDTTISGPHTYRIRYSVEGILRRFDTYDELYWNVTGSDWEAPIMRASARVTAPGAVVQHACYRGTPGSSESCTGSSSDGTAAFSTGVLSPGEGMTVAVGFPAGLVPLTVFPPPPSFADAFTIATLLACIITSVAGFALLISSHRRYGRDRFFRRSLLPGVRSDRTDAPTHEGILPFFALRTIAVEYDAPDGLRPAEIGVLLDEKAHTLDVSSTIVDLASRGHLEIEEIQKTWLFGSTDYRFTKTSTDETELRSYEKLLLSRLFDDGTSVLMSELKNAFYKDLKDVKDALYAELVERKIFPGNPETARAVPLIAGVILVIGATFALFFFADRISIYGTNVFSATGVGILFGLILTGIATIIASPWFSRKTAYGRELYERALGYRLFVSGTEQHRAKFAEDTGLFTRVLPYAIVFGVTGKLAAAFADMGLTPQTPLWYHGTTPFNPAVFASGMDSFSKSLGNAMASAPSGSGSGGGGFSGGGFGGGGGGSW